MAIMSRLALATALFASPAFAAISPLPNADRPVLAMMDPIGTGCIEGGGYDDPFPSSKGVRAPAFCLHDPCKGALSRETLGRDILGHPAENWEWDAYYSRYAEFCRADAFVPRSSGPAVTAETFWAPFTAPGIASYLPGGGARNPVRGPFTGGGTGSAGNPPIPNIPIPSIPIGGGPNGGGGGSSPGGGGGTTPGGGGGTGGGGTSPGGGGGTTPGGGGGTTPGGGGGTTPGGGGGGGPDIPVVPLPLAGWLLASSLAALAGLSRSRRRSS